MPVAVVEVGVEMKTTESQEVRYVMWCRRSRRWMGWWRWSGCWLWRRTGGTTNMEEAHWRDDGRGEGGRGRRTGVAGGGG